MVSPVSPSDAMAQMEWQGVNNQLQSDNDSQAQAAAQTQTTFGIPDDTQ